MDTRRTIVLVAALAAAVLTARLGFWQLDRADQKNTLQAALDAQRRLPPLPAQTLAQAADDVPAQLHRSIVIEGQWLASGTVYLENRQMNGQPGFFVVTPLRLADGSAVLVQRGWQPRDLLDRTKVVEPPTPAGVTGVQGRIAPPPARLYDFDGAASGPIRQNLDTAQYSRELGLRLRPLSIVQEDSVPPVSDGLKRQWLPPATGVHKHYGYAFQWFALCALILGLYAWFQLIRPRRQRRA